MIVCKELDGRSFESKEAMFAELKSNKAKLIAAKKAVTKRADTIAIVKSATAPEQIREALKSLALVHQNPLTKSVDYTKMAGLTNLKVTFVSNTTNWFDSHMDVHIDGLWNKTIADKGQNGFPHFQEHEAEFDMVIADGANVKTYLQNTTFKALGYNVEGSTQALTVDSVIDPVRNLFMYNQYANGWVKQHSVGMQYVELLLCVNSDMPEYAEEKANFDKYYPNIANKAEVDQYGYFWAVTQAKLIEHSAVVMASNEVTPTCSIEIEAEKALQTGAADTPRRRVIY